MTTAMYLYNGVAYAAPPPAGVTPNASAPLDAASLIIVTGIIVPLAVFATGIRIYTRMAIIRKVIYDDYLMVLAVVLSVIMAALVLDMLSCGLGKHLWDVPLDSLYPKWMLDDVVVSMVYCAATGFAKGSILLFYLRIFFPYRGMVVATWSVFVFTIVYSLVFVFVNLFSCQPVSAYWNFKESLTAACINRPLFYFTQAALGIATDVATLVLPLAMLKPLRLPWKQKIGVALVLTVGAFVCVISIIRFQALFKFLTGPDLTMTMVEGLFWCILELNLSIIGGSIPALKPFLQQFFPSLLGESRIRNSGGFNANAGPSGTGDSHQTETIGGSRRKSSACAGGRQSARRDHGDAGSEGFVMQDSIVTTIQHDIQVDPVATGDEPKPPMKVGVLEPPLELHI